MRRALIAANWKMFLNRESATQLAMTLAKKTADVEDRDILICPAAPRLPCLTSPDLVPSSHAVPILSFLHNHHK